MAKRKWLSMAEYTDKWPDDDVWYQKPDYRKDKKTCKFCGKPLTGRRRSYCSDDCSMFFNNWTQWLRGRATLPYKIACRDNFTCQECGEFKAFENEHGVYMPIGKELEIHHIMPVSQGGTDHQDNLITLCVDCHNKKHGPGWKKEFE